MRCRRQPVRARDAQAGFLGGAICTHFRLGEIGSPPQIVCLVLGIMTWAGLYLRNPTLRKLLPLSA